MAATIARVYGHTDDGRNTQASRLSDYAVRTEAGTRRTMVLVKVDRTGFTTVTVLRDGIVQHSYELGPEVECFVTNSHPEEASHAV